MMTRERKIYDREFKQKAVELSYARGSVKEIAEELGIHSELIYRWRREYQKYDHNSFPGKGKPKMTDLERENARLKKGFSSLMGQCKLEGIYFIFLPPHKDKRNPAHKTTHLHTAASQPCKPKFAKELFFC